MRAVWALCALVAAGGCSAALDFHECNVDSDCASRHVDGGAALFCTGDHMCVDPSPCSVAVAATPGARAPLVIAGLFRASGPTAAKDLAIRRGGDLAAIELNSTLGVPVTWVSCDTKSSADGARDALRVATQLFHAVAVVGPETSDELVKGVAPMVKQAGAVVVSPSATNPVIAQLDDAGLIWRTCPSDNLQARVLAGIVPTTAKLDLVYVDMSTYATGLQQAFTASWGGKIDKTITFETGMAATAVSSMTAPTHALFIADVDAPALVASAHVTPSLSTTLFYMTDGAQSPELWGDAPYDYTFLGHIKGTAPGLPANDDPSFGVLNSFASSYSAHFGDNPRDIAYVANTYDAFYAIALAAVAAGDGVTGALIAAGMQRMSKKGAPAVAVGPNQFQQGVNALGSGGEIDLVGASGPLDWNAAGELVSAPIQVWEIVQNGATPAFATLMTVTP